jgi:hypothetical protein
MTATPLIVGRETWEEQVQALRVREKAHTREADAIAAARRATHPAVVAAGRGPLRRPRGDTGDGIALTVAGRL